MSNYGGIIEIEDVLTISSVQLEVYAIGTGQIKLYDITHDIDLATIIIPGLSNRYVALVEIPSSTTQYQLNIFPSFGNTLTIASARLIIDT